MVKSANVGKLGNRVKLDVPTSHILQFPELSQFSPISRTFPPQFPLLSQPFAHFTPICQLPHWVKPIKACESRGSPRNWKLRELDKFRNLRKIGASWGSWLILGRSNLGALTSPTFASFPNFPNLSNYARFPRLFPDFPTFAHFPRYTNFPMR